MKSVDRILKLAGQFEKKMVKYAQTPAVGGSFDPVVDRALKAWQYKYVNQALSDPSTNAPEGEIHAKFGVEALISLKGIQVSVNALPVTSYDAATGKESVRHKDSLDWSKRVVDKFGPELVKAVKASITPQMISNYFKKHPTESSVKSGVTAQFDA